MSPTPFVSPGTRLLASEWNATKRPLSLTDPSPTVADVPFPPAPFGAALLRMTVVHPALASVSAIATITGLHDDISVTNVPPVRTARPYRHGYPSVQGHQPG